MSVVYLSFASIAELHNNSNLSVSPIGELTNKARTYAKDPGVFTLAGASPTTLYNFQSTKDNAPIVMPQARATEQLNISNWLLEQAKLGNITGSRANTLSLLKQQFTNNLEILEVGEMVTNNNIWLPSFVRGNHIVGAEKQEFYLWMAEAYFRDQYPVISFTIVHPLPLAEIDKIIELNYQQLEERIKLETPDVIERRTRDLTDQAAWPHTDRTVHSFAALDLVNTPNQVMLYWRVLSWGNFEDAEDQLYDQIQKEILEASKHPRSKWEEVLPDLFNPLEFYVIPNFDRLGLENRTDGARTYSPVVDRETEAGLVDKYLTPNMTPEHVIKSMQVVPFLYKSLAASFVAKVNNRQGMQKFTNLYPDYQLISALDSDSGMMNNVTLEFLIQMEGLLAASEIVTDISLPPTGVSRIERFGKLYVARRIGRARFMVLIKWQMIQDDVIEG